MSAFEPTDEQIEALAKHEFERDNPDFKFDLMSPRTKERGAARYRELVATDAFRAIIRTAQAAAWDSGHVAGWDERDAYVQEGWMPSGYASDTPNPYREADRA